MAASAMITTLDEFEAEYRKGIGYRMPARGSREASIDNIRRFGDGAGDYNPLYRSEEYARASRFGMVTAPPIFIYGASLGIAMAINGNIDGRRLSSSHFPMLELFLFTHGVVGTGRSPRAALDAEQSKDRGGGGRYDAEHARNRRNMPGQFDWGPQRACWLAQMATDWMGDHGTLKRMETRVRHPNVVGDTNTVFGKVARKYPANGENLVELAVYNENQAGLATAESTITVALPGRTA